MAAFAAGAGELPGTRDGERRAALLREIQASLTATSQVLQPRPQLQLQLHASLHMRQRPCASSMRSNLPLVQFFSRARSAQALL